MDVTELVAQLTPEQLAKIVVDLYEKAIDDGWMDTMQIIDWHLDELHFNRDRVLK